MPSFLTRFIPDINDALELVDRLPFVASFFVIIQPGKLNHSLKISSFAVAVIVPFQKPRSKFVKVEIGEACDSRSFESVPKLEIKYQRRGFVNCGKIARFQFSVEE